MSINKFLLVSLVFVAFSATAQTVDSYGNSSSSLQTPLGQPLPMVQQEPDRKNAATSSKRGTHLTGIFVAAGGGHAEFIVDGQVEYYGVGDIMRGGWEIASITSTTVNLKKCGSAKSRHCTTKKYAYQGS